MDLDSHQTVKPISLTYVVGSLFFIAATCFFVYANSLQGVFLLDDYGSIVDEPRIRSLTPLTDQLLSGKRPFMQLSFALNYQKSGLETESYHWFNLCVHSLAAFFLFAFATVAFRTNQFSTTLRSNAHWIGLTSALVWAVHPLNTQAVTYIVQRGESMMGMSLFAFLFALAIANRSSIKSFWLSMAFLFFIFGLGSKQVMVMALPLAILYQRIFVEESWSATIANRKWFWLCCFCPLLAAFIWFLPQALNGSGGAGFGLSGISSLDYLCTQPEVILHYLRLVIFPDSLVFDYGWPIQESTAKIGIAGIAFATLLASLLVLWLYGQGHWAFWGLAVPIILLPTSSILPIQDLAVEHRMYAPNAFVIVLLTAIIFLLVNKFFANQSNLVLVAVFGLIVCGLGYLTIKRNEDYSDEVRMWRDVIAKTVERGKENVFAGRIYSNLGRALGDQESWDESIVALQQALEEQKFPTEVFGNLVRAYLAKGDVENAKNYVVMALEVNPNSAKIMQQAGLIYAAEKDYANAEQFFRKAVGLDESDATLTINLAQSLILQNKIDEAVVVLKRSITVAPKNTVSRRRLISLLLDSGKLDLAIREIEDYRREIPDDVYTNFLQAVVLIQQGNTENVIPLLESSLSAKPLPPNVHYLLGDEHRKSGNLLKARRHYENSIQQNPNNVKALTNLGGILVQTEPMVALGYFQRVLNIAPNYIPAKFNVASINAGTGEFDEAKKHLNEILSIDPEYQPAKNMLEALSKETLQRR